MEDSASDRRQINAAYNNQSAPQGMPKFQSPSFLSNRNPSQPELSASSDHSLSGPRWRLNGTGQLVDQEAETASWDLADDIVRLKVSNGIDSSDDLHGPMRTPPQNKRAVAAVSQFQESSPLETSSDASLDSGSSPHASDQHLALPNHSRGSSTDTTASSQLSGSSHTLQPSALGLKIGNGSESRDRPHSYSGGLSTADLRRLQTAGSPLEGSPVHQRVPGLMSAIDRPGQQEQPAYPSLASYPRQQVHVQGPAAFPHQIEDPQMYAMQQRQFQPVAGGDVSRAAGAINGMSAYRGAPARGYDPQMQGMMPNAPNVGYPAPPAHTAHLSLGNAQQLYDVMMPHENPAVARVQQQHNVFRATHQHSASDPLHLREAAALMNAGLPPFAPGMYPAALAPPAMGLYPNQFYPQEAYAPNAAQIMAARLQSQYPGAGPYGMAVPSQSISPPVSNGVATNLTGGSSVAIDPSGNGPSANNRKLGLYKTELCRSWEEKGTCRYGPKCQFAHGEDEIRKYKTEICRTFWVSGSCPYGKRCCFIHTELPASGAPPGADGAPPPKVTETRNRSDSDSNEAPVSLLARISAKRNQDAVNNAYIDGEMSMSNSYQQTQQTSRPPTGSLRVDTSSLDPPIVNKQNKSAYPSFATNGVLFSSAEQTGSLSPGPVTAGPDLGRRGDFTALTQARLNHKHSTSSSNRHSFNGADVSINLNTPQPASGHTSPFAAPLENNASRTNGHARSGSAGNWANYARSGHLAAPIPFHGPQSASPGNEPKLSTPWLTAEVGAGSRWN
ncbi:hypothetical protein EWM64_g282 [Hericium alpestre]|uniref:C3H1-type domain-containing protein n=1 Tax=Hericium alpestre TaxID=135208 RepID=A0A4Z0ABL5_9AGAM|nr:hypothetical protein EWM64_g282 [Hericium alpestre]